MNLFLTNKNILLGVTGSIAAYKSADLVRRLREAGCLVRVVMTENAKRFITPLTMQAVSGYPIHEDLFDLHAEAAMGHIELARWADLVLIAPASADFMARLAQGLADDLLTTLCLATTAKILVAPAMNQGMWQHNLTQDNVKALQKKAVTILGPAEGSQACGDVGLGRMLEPSEIIKNMNAVFATGLLSGCRVLVTAGPTHEAIDPIRFISNASSGKMGYALAQAAVEVGANVTLISGPTALATPPHLQRIDVISAKEMHAAVMKAIPACDLFISVAAVSDYRPQTVAAQKIHKDKAIFPLVLERNPDIISDVAALKKPPFIVGFAAETENVISQANAKRQRKNMDVIVANKVGTHLGFGMDEHEITVLFDKKSIKLGPLSKAKLARRLISLIAKQYKNLEK